VIGIEVEGATPRKKPTVTIVAAPITLVDGVEDVLREEIKIVNGSWSPRAI
jgi:hypothetical protein